MIRPAVNQDFEKIDFLSQELGYEIETKEIVNKRLENIINSTIDYLMVYEDEGIIKGWIHFFIANRVASESFVEIGGLVVNPNTRREGIGRSLVEYTKNWSINNRYSIRVRCNSKREETHVFYSALGFSNKKTQFIFQI